MGKAADRLARATLQKQARAARPPALRGSGCAPASGACWRLTVAPEFQIGTRSLFPPSSPGAPRGDGPRLSSAPCVGSPARPLPPGHFSQPQPCLASSGDCASATPASPWKGTLHGQVLRDTC